MLYRTDGFMVHLVVDAQSRHTLCGDLPVVPGPATVPGPVTCTGCLRAAQAAFGWVLMHYRDDVQSKATTAAAVPLGRITPAGRALPAETG